jgi:signal transduction histidine kinase
MSKISDTIEKSRIEKLLKQYFEAFKAPVFLFDEDENLLFRFPEHVNVPRLTMASITLREEVVGYVALPDGKAAKHFLDFIANNLSCIMEMGFEIENLSAEVAKNYEELHSLWGLSSRLRDKLDVGDICIVLANEVMCICPSSNILVLLVAGIDNASHACCVKDCEVNPAQIKKTLFFPKVSIGKDANKMSMMTFDLETCLLGYVFANKEPITKRDVSRDAGFKCLPYPVKSILIVPIIVEEAMIGAILANDKLNGEEFFTTEIKLVQGIASECAVSIKKAQLFEHIRLAKEALRVSDEQLRILSSHLLIAQETERKKISLELHDDLGQTLSFLKLGQRFVMDKLPDEQRDLKEVCGENLHAIDDVIDNIRRISRDLSPSILEDLGLIASLRRLIDDFDKYNDTIETSVTMPDIDHLFTKIGQIFIYRIFQEALTNICKHSQARHMFVAVGQTDDNLVQFNIEDDGRGFDVQKVIVARETERGLGIAAMRQRVQILGGFFSITSREEKGTRISFSIPVRKKEEKDESIQDCFGRRSQDTEARAKENYSGTE